MDTIMLALSAATDKGSMYRCSRHHSFIHVGTSSARTKRWKSPLAQRFGEVSGRDQLEDGRE